METRNALREAVEQAVRTLEDQDGYYTVPDEASTGEGKEYACILQRVLVILRLGLEGKSLPDYLTDSVPSD